MSDRLAQLHLLLQNAAQAQGGFLPFDEFMHLALYAPNLGYYASTEPVGTATQGGDFTTAPQLSKLFGSTLAQSLVPVFEAGLPLHILECGAGTGKLAADLIDRLSVLGYTNVRYSILEVSARLRAQQKQTLQGFGGVAWLNALPTNFEGVVLGNELLDAMPTKAYELQQTPQGPTVQERGVVWQTQANHGQDNASKGNWFWAARPLPEPDQARYLAVLPTESAAQDAYQFEVCDQAQAWVTSVAEQMKRGLILLVDYGFPRHELYHPQRAGGTLMGHHRHTASSNVLDHIGAADITAHVDFTAIARAAQQAGLNLTGYTSQARFLINAGIAAAYEAAVQNAPSALEQAQLSRGLQYLMSEAEMGELFKVIAFGKACSAPLGFERGDRSLRLHYDF